MVFAVNFVQATAGVFSKTKMWQATDESCLPHF